MARKSLTVSSDSIYRPVLFFLLAFLLAGATAGVLIEMGLGWDFANFYDAGAKGSCGSDRGSLQSQGIDSR